MTPKLKYTEDLTGRVYGKLTITGRSTRGPSWWVAQCSCGNVRVLAQHVLRTGRYKSCGCGLKAHRKLRKMTTRFVPQALKEDYER